MRLLHPDSRRLPTPFRLVFVRTAVLGAGALVLLPLLAAPLSAASPSDVVSATVETQPVGTGGDSADDPAIWIHPEDTSLSLILGTNKNAGLGTYNLDGTGVQFLEVGSANNVDVRYNFPLDGELVDLITFSNRSNNTIGVYTINPSTRLLEDVATRSIGAGIDVYGACMYHSPVTGDFYHIVNSKAGEVELWRLYDDGSGMVDAESVRRFDVGSQTEGCVADDELGFLYIGEEAVAIWKYGAEPGDGDTRTKVDDTVGHFTADVEGLALYYGADGTGYLIASSQGSDEFVVYRREGSNEWVTTFQIVAGSGIDGVSSTDGIDVTNFPLSTGFPMGLFIAHDGSNDDGNQNYKLVPWESVAWAASPPLTIDLSYDPRDSGGGPDPDPPPPTGPRGLRINRLANVHHIGRFMLSVAKSGQGSGTVISVPAGIQCGMDCTQEYPNLTEVTLLATPDPGSVFNGWIGGSDCGDSVVTMSHDVSCTATFGPTPNGRVGVWTSSEELSQLPMSGPAWENLLSAATGDAGTPDISNQDDPTNVKVMAKALVYARTGDASYRAAVLGLLHDAVGTEEGGRTLALGRELAAYVISADLIDLTEIDPVFDNTVFRPWLGELLTKTLSGMTLVSTHEIRPNNWGTHAGASRAAVARYLGDEAELARTAEVFKGWLGDRSSYAGFDYGSLDWQCDPALPVGINPKGCTKNGHSIDGVIPDDQRRGGGFQWPPQKEGYVYEGLQGALAQAVILSRAGYDVWNWEDRALLRAFQWLHEQADFPAEGDDTWQPHVINHYYGTSFPAPVPSRSGKNVGWTDWTHQK